MSSKKRRLHSSDGQSLRKAKERGHQESQAKARPLGEILVFGAMNAAEHTKLAEYDRRKAIVHQKYFAGRDLDIAAAMRLMRSSAKALHLTEGQLRHAIMGCGCANMGQLLDRIAAEALVRLEREGIPPILVRASTEPQSARVLGPGGHPNDCCQACGKYLFQECYARSSTKRRIPRTNKLCRPCFLNLSLEERRGYRRRQYKHGHEPRGTGGNSLG